MNQRFQTYMGMKVVTNPLLTKTIEDWSNCRSPTRAKRRWKRGYPQRVHFTKIPDMTILAVGDTYVMHPAAYQVLLMKTVEAPLALSPRQQWL